MRFKLDENLPIDLAAELRALRHETDTVADEGLCLAADPTVVEAASIAGRILLTLDRGIADVRCERRASIERIPEITSLDLADRLTVVGPSRIRSR